MFGLLSTYVLTALAEGNVSCWPLVVDMSVSNPVIPVMSDTPTLDNFVLS